MKNDFCFFITRKYYLIAFFCFISNATMVLSQVSQLNLIQPLQISHGDSIVLQDIVDNVIVNGERAEVSMNYADVSVLSSGRHKIIFSAITFSGFTETFETTLDVDDSTNISDSPQIQGLKDFKISQGKILDLKLYAKALAADGKLLPLSVNVKYPEHLSVGVHKIYYTAVDSQGRSAVKKIEVTVSEVEMKYRRVEWAMLGKHLYDKYFEPSRYDQDLDGVYSYFIYNVPYSTESGIQILMFFENPKYDSFSFDSKPLKIESLMARLMLLLKELHHHRYLWIDQSQIVVSLSEFMPFQITTASGDTKDVHKDRGIYGFTIPKAIFKHNDFDQYVLDAFKSMSEAPMNSPTRRIRHHLYHNSSNGIKILYYQMHSGVLWDEYKDRVASGAVTLEENFDFDMFDADYKSCMQDFDSGVYGRFTNPKAPMLNYEVQ